MTICRGLVPCLAAAVLIVTACNDDSTNPNEAAVPTQGSASLAAAGAPLSWYQLSAGLDGFHTCGLTTANKAYCWGTGYLGDGPAASNRRPAPVAVTGGFQFRQISVGYQYTCAVTTGDRAYCWGQNAHGELGDGTTSTQPIPVPAAPNLRFREVQAGFFTTCGLTTANRVYCWGSSAGGRMGTGTSAETNGNPPTQIAGGRTYNQVEVGMSHACAVTFTNEIYCWGDNHYGQLGDSTAVKRRNSPRRVWGTQSFAKVSAGWQLTCAVTTGKTAYCWGYGGNGEVGDGSNLNRWEPRRVAGGLSFGRVTSGVNANCGETTGNRAYCWGFNGFGSLGDGTHTSRNRPAQVAGGLWFAQVSAGNGTTCGVTSEHRGYCWGYNYHGTVGDGTTTDRSTPTPIAGPS